MKRFLLCSCLCVSVSVGIISQEIRPIISILDFKGSNIAEAELVVFVDYVTSLVVESGLFRVIDRSQRETLLTEIEFSLSGCTDEACQLEIGRLLSAKYIIIGSLGTVGSRYLLNMKMIDIETSETFASASERYLSMDELIDDADRLVGVFVGSDQTGKKDIEAAGDSSIRRGTVEGKEVELITVPERRPVDADPDWKRQGLELGFGYMEGPFIAMYGGYVYDIFRFIGLGAMAGFSIADETYYDYGGYSYSEPATEFLWGVKAYFGRREKVAFATGTLFMGERSLPFIGFYFDRAFFDITADTEKDSVYVDLGYSMSF
ncbi:MAG: hypothetical protein JXB03_07540 [Spirochaetales bacterium]|nr:hypothetical protein [Spirochaetales bacterium]